jgi:membrane-anchored glycerophosphoryl diester phosphodiesterase (GDPDase)
MNITFIFYVAVRLSMMLPAAAIGDQANPSQSLRLTRHIGWRLMGLYVLIMLVFAVLTSLVLLPMLEHPPVRWIIGVINAIFGVVGVAAIATVYRKLSVNEPAKG